MSKARVACFVAIVACALASAYLLLRLRQYSDDAFITFRVARNLALGRGPYFNPEERVQGSTTPLYVLVLAAGHRVSGLPVDRFEEVLEVPLVLALALALFLLVRSSPSLRTCACLAPLLLFLHPASLCLAKGMETFLYCALIAGAFAAEARGRPVWLGIAIGLTASTRTEGGLLAISYLVYWFVGRQIYGTQRYRMNRLTRSVGAALLVGLPILLALIAWYGNPVPNSVMAKIDQQVKGWPSTVGTYLIDYLFGGWNIGIPQVWGAVLVLGAALLLVRFLRGRGLAESEYRTFGFLTLHVALYTLLFFGAPYYAWYLVPISIMLIPLYAASLVGLGRFAQCLAPTSRAGFGKFWRTLARGLVFAFLAYVACQRIADLVLTEYSTRFNPVASLPSAPERGYSWMGRYLSENAGQTGWTFAAEEIGLMGYACDLPCLDLAALVSPQCRPFFMNEWMSKTVLRFKPELYVSPRCSEIVAGEPEYDPQLAQTFYDTYRLVRRVETHDMGTIRVFCRKDLTWPEK